MKKIYNLLLLLAVPSTLLLYSYSGGSPGGKTGSLGDNGNTCTDCHTGIAQSQTDWVTSDIPVTGYQAGETYEITVSGTDGDASLMGFELTAEDDMGNKVGTFTLTETDRTKFTNANKAVTHTSAGTAVSGGKATWSVSWTAPDPAPENVIFNAAFNAANGNGGTSGDVIHISEAAYSQYHVGIAENLLAEKVSLYPNPAIENLNISAPEGTSYTIVDLNGRIIENSTVFTSVVSINVADYENGLYMVKFTSEGITTTKKLLVN